MYILSKYLFTNVFALDLLYYHLQLKTWSLDKMPKYLIPTKVVITEELPKNHMGKVNKKELLKTFF